MGRKDLDYGSAEDSYTYRIGQAGRVATPKHAPPSMMQLYIPHLEQHSVPQLPFSRRLIPSSESLTTSV